LAEGLTITEHEAEQVERANASSAPPVVFVHGLWLLPSSWDRWVTLFEEVGYVGVTPVWPAWISFKEFCGQRANVKLHSVARRDVHSVHCPGAASSGINCS